MVPWCNNDAENVGLHHHKRHGHILLLRNGLVIPECYIEALIWESYRTAVVSPALQYMCTKKDVADAVFTAGRAFGPERLAEGKQLGNKGD